VCGGGDVKRTHVYITTPTPLDGYIYKFACGHTVYLDCGRAGKPGPSSVATSVRKEKGGKCFCATNTLHCCTHFRLWHTYRTPIGFPTVFYLFPTLASSVKLFGCFVCLFVLFPFEKKTRDWNVEKLPIITRRNTCCWLHGGMRCSGAHERRRHFFSLSGWLLLQPVIQLQQQQQQRDK
jgi:hypothetical protein